MNILLCIVLVVVLESQQYRGSESSGFVKVVVTISGGLSAIPIIVIVNTAEQTATGEGCVSTTVVITVLS